MSLHLRRRFRATLLALCALLLAQWTLVTHACPTIRLVGDLTAQLQWVEGGDELGDTGCGGHGDDGRDAGSTPVCVKHCTDEGSASGSSTQLAAGVAMPSQSSLRVPAQGIATPAARQTSPPSGDATTPPLSILYCVFLT